MDITADLITEGAVHHLVSLQRTLANETVADDRRLKMRVVRAADPGCAASQVCHKHGLNLFWSHGLSFTPIAT